MVSTVKKPVGRKPKIKKPLEIFIETYQPKRRKKSHPEDTSIEAYFYNHDKKKDKAKIDKAYSEKRVWTYCSTDEGDYLVNGNSIVDRLGYLITKVPYTEKPLKLLIKL